MRFSLFLVLLFFVTFCEAQLDINQFDSNNKRHGIWEKFHPNSKQIRYQGTFSHGKEIGVFKYYCIDCGDIPMVVKTFNDSNSLAVVQYFTKKEKLVSEGKMDGKNRVGEWIYFQKNSNNIMTKENYVNGKLEGLKYTYYINKVLTEEILYKNGIKEGLHNYYSLEGVLLKKLQNKNNQLNGLASYYDAYGNLIIEGNYKNGKKHGLWKYYKNGKIVKEETFPKPRK
jgi:antitoxin component YwqK of YwqJK toxin-antitoxin module